jgi:Glycosyltransferase family 17
MSPARRAQVLDVFCYNGEPVVERRLAYLAPKVDKFVVVEARQTHSGRPKPGGLFVERHADMFEKYDCEIVVVDAFPAPPPDWADRVRECPWVRDPAAWWREHFQREQALPVVRRLAAERPTVALVCDSDEIPSHDAIECLVANYDGLKRGPVHLAMDVFYYSFRWRLSDERWHKAFAICSEALAGPVSLTATRNARPVALLEDGAGWHCSYFMDAAGVRRKLESFAHTEIGVPGDDADIEDIMRRGADVARRPGLVLTQSRGLPPPL